MESGSLGQQVSEASMTSQLYNLCLQNSGAAESRAAAAGANTPESLLHIFLSPLFLRSHWRAGTPPSVPPPLTCCFVFLASV